MAVYVQFDADGEQEHLATNHGWAEVGKWIDGLDAGKHGELVQLWEHGVSERPAELTRQLESALQSSPPKDEHAKATAKLLLGALDANAEAEVVLTTNGMGPSGGDAAG